MGILGIDPGKSGGMAVVGPPGTDPWIRRFKSLTYKDVLECFEIASELADFAFLEKVNAMPGDGKRRMGATSAMSFGENVGMLKMALTATEIPHELVSPTKWQKEFGLLRKKNEGKTDKKNRHKAEAQRLFPSTKITHAIADALLIAEYGRRVQNGYRR